MRAIILAAGRGSRMKDLTDERPKCLVELRGKPLLEWQLEALRGAGISEIAIVTGYKREMLANRGLIEFHNERWADTQMLTSLACASEWLISDTCIVTYSDIFYSSNAVTSLKEISAELAITYDPNWLGIWGQRFENPLDDAETFKINSKGILVEIGKKASVLEEIEGQYMGLLRFEPKGWAEIERIRDGLKREQRDKIHMTGILQKVIGEGRLKVVTVPYEGEWGEVDCKEDLRVYE